MSIVLENTGTRRIRIAGQADVTKVVSIATGREVRPYCIIDLALMPTSIRTFRALTPGQRHEVDFWLPCGGVPHLPGTYEIHATFSNHAGWPHVYDVYERGADEVWEGTVTMPPVTVTMLPPVISSRSTASNAQRELPGSEISAVSTLPATVLPRLEIEGRPRVQDLADYLNTILLGGSDDARSLALRGIARYGGRDMYTALRQGLPSSREETRYRVGAALSALTFTREEDGGEGFVEPAYWDAWWMRHGRKSREHWAREALKRRETPWQALRGRQSSPAARAADYLVTLHRADERLVRELSQHRSWRVRLATADAVASFDQRRAGELMIRELHNRYLAACGWAADRLSQLARTPYGFDCYDPAGRERGIEHWRREVGRLPRTPLVEASPL